MGAKMPKASIAKHPQLFVTSSIDNIIGNIREPNRGLFKGPRKVSCSSSINEWTSLKRTQYFGKDYCEHKFFPLHDIHMCGFAEIMIGSFFVCMKWG